MGKIVQIKIGELAKKRNISLREMSRKSDVSHSTLSELANQKRQRIEIRHLEKIADSLEIDDIRELIDFEDRKDA